ncbi:MAG TPA: S41 family peptidase [Longimicrobiaceae bacterium]|nr:S41 family peptidase [Longimicrobiaceae bacterium]
MLPRLLALLAAAVLALGTPARAPAQAAADTLAVPERERIVSGLDAAIRRYFAHWSAVPGLDYPAAYRAYRERAMASSDRREFDLATLEFLAGLRNGHTDFNDRWLWERHGAPFPFSLRSSAGEWRVAWSGTPDLQPGDVVAAIDGEPFEAFFQRQKRYISASDERAARRRLSSQDYLFPERFTLTLGDGRHVAVVRERPTAPAVPAAAGPAAEAVPHRWLVQDSIAYLKVPGFGDPRYEARALELLKTRYRSAPALIVDLRGNGGGSTPWKLRKALMGGQGYRRWEVEEEKVGAPLLYRAAGPLVLRLYPVPAYRGKLVFLVDGGCASACEDLVVSFKDNGRATLVGETTFGSTGQAFRMDFGNGMTARIGGRRVRLPGGAPFEGVGIAPDVPVAPAVPGARGDPVLERGLAVLRGPGGS